MDVLQMLSDSDIVSFEDCEYNELSDAKSVHLPNYYVRNLSIESPAWGHNITVQGESFSMTRNEFILLSLAFANIKQNDDHFEPINIPLINLCRLAGSELRGSNDYKSWIATIRRLSTRTLNYVEAGHAIVFCPYFSVCRIDLATKIVTLKLNPDLAPYFLSLDKNKAIFLYGYLRQLNSINSCLLYLLCVSARQGDYNLVVALEHLKAAHGYSGENKRFIGEILLPAIYEVNQRTDITIAIEYKKHGRSISGIRFATVPKTKKEMTTLGISPTSKRVARTKLSAEAKQSLFIDPGRPRASRDILIGKFPN